MSKTGTWNLQNECPVQLYRGSMKHLVDGKLRMMWCNTSLEYCNTGTRGGKYKVLWALKEFPIPANLSSVSLNSLRMSLPVGVTHVLMEATGIPTMGYFFIGIRFYSAEVQSWENNGVELYFSS
ncbi:hypothetical protein AV530_018626 [Patagioenas fasciata monilis]|uniref:Uncharacterized protein n=1 Tax=Patagioenas fasciata monilis TaxID=372326 RepID=A0A1V4JGM3_PATFA|nr:hypothetical protein AV530_018626 [Patagioenas fasciata monilis]